MLESLTAATFEPHVGTEFRVDSDSGEPVTLALAVVSALGRQPNAPRAEPFALQFSGPAIPILDQRIYRLEHVALGSLEIFLVPIGPDPDRRMRYEAVFN